jgi:hypothetical protein
MQSHFGHLLLFSGLVSTFFGTISRGDLRRRVRFGLGMAACMVLLSLALAWAMYPFPG